MALNVGDFDDTCIKMLFLINILIIRVAVPFKHTVKLLQNCSWVHNYVRSSFDLRSKQVGNRVHNYAQSRFDLRFKQVGNHDFEKSNEG